MQAFGTLIFAGLGAFIANLAAKLIEAFVRRKQASEAQRDSDLSDLIAAAKLLGELSEKFWTKSAAQLAEDDQILRSHMVAQQHNIAELVESLFTGSKGKWECDVKLHHLLITATGGKFGEPDRDAEPGQLTAILMAVHALIHQAKAARRKMRRHFLA